jgi:hypothetical protein
MKKNFAIVLSLLVTLAGCSMRAKSPDSVWVKYDVGKITFEDKAAGTKGSQIYHTIIPNPESYIAEQAREVLATLYDSPADSIQSVRSIYYTLEDKEGISAKGGGRGRVHIFYSSRHVENSFRNNDTTKVLFETRGVLLHELTHAYQLEPQGIGSYGDSKVVWAFIEGMADAVRVANGGFEGPAARPRGGNYMDGYRTAGYFFVWLRDNKDPEFLRKFNRSTLEVVPWSFDGAIKHILGNEYDIDALWLEYQIAVGDIKA